MSGLATETLVSVVVPAYNEGRHIVSCLQAICANTHRNLEIIVVDDASTDDTAGQVVAFADPRVQLIHSKRNHGPAWAYQRGACSATGDYFFFTDADCTVDRHWIEEGLRSLRQPGVCAVEGMVRYEVLDAKVWHQIPLNPLYNLDRPGNLTVPNQDYANGNFAVRRDDFERVGGIDFERYPNGREDTDLGLRLRRTGTIAFNPKMSVVHSAEEWTTVALLRNARRYAADVRIYRDHGTFSYMRNRLIHPRLLEYLLFPPLMVKRLGLRSVRELGFLPKLLLYLAAVRLVVWRAAIRERVFVL